MLSLVIALLFIVYTNEAANSPPLLPTDEHGDYNAADIIQWIRSTPDGFIHNSLRIGRETPGDPASINGLFLQSDGEAIDEGELIASIPWDCTINIGKKYAHNKYKSCASVYKLAEELRAGEKSSKAPYTRYLLSLPRGSTFPDEWNDITKDFLSVLLGYDELPPYEETWKDHFQKEWVEKCAGDETDDMERAAFYLAQSRDEDTLMVPIYDMMNHLNDPKKLNTNSYKPRRAEDVFRIVASRRIEPGEQVYSSYNRCNKCSIDLLGVNTHNCETFSFHRTSDLFSLFGFVEDYPQWWSFDSGSATEPSEFDVCMIRNAKSGTLEAYYTADEQDVEWAEIQLTRLKKLLKGKDDLEKELVGEGDDKIGHYQWDMMWRYHGVLVTALDAVSESSSSFESSADFDGDSSSDEDDGRNEHEHEEL